MDPTDPQRETESGQVKGHASWRQRHGATIIAVLVIALLALTIVLNS